MQASPERSCVQPSPFWVSPLARSVRREGGQPQVPAPWRSTWSQPGPGPCGATPNAPPVERAAPARDAGRTAVIDGGSQDLAERSQGPPPSQVLDRWRVGGSSQHGPQCVPGPRRQRSLSSTSRPSGTRHGPAPGRIDGNRARTALATSTSSVSLTGLPTAWPMSGICPSRQHRIS